MCIANVLHIMTNTNTLSSYCCRQIFEREIHNYSDDEKLVNFTERRYFYLDEASTTGSLDDNITVVNVPYAVSIARMFALKVCVSQQLQCLHFLGAEYFAIEVCGFRAESVFPRILSCHQPISRESQSTSFHQHHRT